MFLRMSRHIVQNVKLIKLIQLAYIRLESVEPWQKENATMKEKKVAMADRNIRFRESLLKQLRNKLFASNAKCVAT